MQEFIKRVVLIIVNQMICLPLHRQRPQILNTSQQGPFNVIQLWRHKQEPPDLQLLLHFMPCIPVAYH